MPRFFETMLSINEIRRPIEEDFHVFERSYEAALNSENPLLCDMLTYLLAKRGKQIRPLLTLFAAKICHGITDKTIQTAVALELLHTASLVHDDVVDSSVKRRGMDAIQIRWGNKAAILLGDYMLSRVINIVANIRNIKILNIISELGSALASGELLQLHANSSMWIEEEQYYRVIESKTAKLFASCMEAGGESSCASMRQVSALRTFGLHLGMCFQIKDDIFDYSDSEDIGKPTMNDIRDGKVTLPLIIALKRASKEEAEHIRSIAEELANHSEHINKDIIEQEIKSFVLRFDGIRYAYQQIHWHQKRAIEALQVFHDSPIKQHLLMLLEYTIYRIQ